MQPREFLMIPGPTPVPDAVLEAVARHPIGHRTPEFSRCVREVTEGLKWLGDTANDVFVLTSSGSGGMESAIANTVSAGDSVLSLIVGVFGERWAKIAEAFGATVDRIVSEPGQPIDVERVRERLAAEGRSAYRAVTMTHNETSTGVINDVDVLAKLAREHGALSIVDAVTSFGAVPVPVNEIDVLVTGSQKALMLPPGLAVVFFGPDAWKASDVCKSPRFYLDLRKYKKSLAEDTTPMTPNVSLFMGLNASLNMMREEGKPAIFARHERMKTALRAGLKAMGLKLLVEETCASPTITAILPPDGISVSDIRKKMKERFRILMADGQEALKGKIFRIGHMGYVFERDILMTLSCLEAVLLELGHKCESGRAVTEASLALR